MSVVPAWLVFFAAAPSLRAAVPNVSVQAPSSVAELASRPNSFLVTRAGALKQPLDVVYSTSGTATNGTDYQRLPNRVTIPAGEASARIQVLPIRNRPGEGQKTVAVQLVDPVRPFSLAVLPDTQNYSALLAGGTPEMLGAQTRWILDHKDELNIAFVLQEGDCTNNNTLPEWQRFKAAMSLLDGQVPYAISPGNHDGLGGKSNATGLFNRFFPLSEYERSPVFGQAFEPARMDNCYQLFSAGGIDWLVLVLEFGPRNEVLVWANQVVTGFPNRRVIVVTHAHIYPDNSLQGSSSSHANTPKSYGRDNDGTDVWEKFLRLHPNTTFVFNGHMGSGGGTGRFVGTNDQGNRVFQMLADFQSRQLGGGGFLRIVQFFPEQDRMSVSTYSPYLDAWLRDEGNQFEYSPLGVFANSLPSYRVDPTRARATLEFNPNPGAQLSNLSVRSRVGTGGQTLIVGFVIDGGSERILLRGIGPALALFGLTGVLTDPQLGLFDSRGTQISRNDGWGGSASLSTAFNTVGAFALPVGAKDTALLSSLPPGAYTAQVNGATNAPGVALVEAYDVEAWPAPARFRNFSARSQVGTGDNILIAGFVVDGPREKTLLIRGVGLGLREVFPQYFSTTDVLTDPRLAIFTTSGVMVAENDNWSTSLAPYAQQVSAFPLSAGSLDAALLITLPPGPYTAQLSGFGGTTGIALVEVYDLDP